LDAIRALGVSDISLDHLPFNRLRALARYAAAARAQAISRMAPERRTATLLAFAHAFERTAMDDAIDVLDGLVSDIVRGAHKEGKRSASGLCMTWIAPLYNCGMLCKSS
jgi:hypothetical protein